MRPKVKAIGLLSGGLDSTLAVRVLQEQGIGIVGLSFKTPFFGPSKAKKAAHTLGIKLIVKDITYPHLKIVKNPPHGRGRTMNPCIDCHAFMVREACKIMKKRKLDFVFTGEVLGERPMSQNRKSLEVVAEESGCHDRLLRPLSARLLPMTRPERLGLVERDKLLNISGRSRKRQFALAEKYGIREYPTPAGGCLLTDPQYSKRLEDLLEHNPNASRREIELLRIGRHFRVSNDCKLVIGRREEENRDLQKLTRLHDVSISCEHIPGPRALLVGKALGGHVKEAASAVLAYSDAGEGEDKLIYVKKGKRRFKIKLICNRESRLTYKRI